MDEAVQVIARLTAAERTLVTAESCTGGNIAARFTAMPGASAYFLCGVVSYSNASKHDILGVDPEVIARHGAVSEPVVLEMTRGCLARSDAGICVAISGIAGPGGGSEEKPVGTVWFAWADRTGRHHSLLARFDGDRHQVRQQAVRQALSGLLALLR